jgi:pimeloyl-ACP methyl ester carboxylesterase
MAQRERDVAVEGITLRVVEYGDPRGEPVLHFHGTPGSRVELAWADEVLHEAGVRVIAFDRPGYGGSPRAPFSVGSIAKLALGLADSVGVDRFRTLGWSGGGPFALATAAIAEDRVPRVGVIAGAAPFQLVPGALERLSAVDARAARLLPGDPEQAAAGFLEGFDLGDALTSPKALFEWFEPLTCAWDRAQLTVDDHAQALFASVAEGLIDGAWGCAWDNVAWIGPWDVDPTTLRCPVLLWYGSDDRMATPAYAHWFEDNLADGRLTMWEGEGHLLAFAHLAEMLEALLA